MKAFNGRQTSGKHNGKAGCPLQSNIRNREDLDAIDEGPKARPGLQESRKFSDLTLCSRGDVPQDIAATAR